jgi:primosomal protein N' (replication factor Y) (superfamily II helicase)
VPRSEPEGTTADTPLRIARVAVEGAPLHLGDTLDYLATDALSVGHRVEVVLAGRRTRGLVTAIVDGSDIPRSRLRPVGRLLGDVPWTDEDGVGLLAWASGRFGAPLGDVVRHALPNRVVDEERRAEAAGWWPPQPADLLRTRNSTASGGEGASVRTGVDWSHYGDAGLALSAATSSGSGSFLLSPLPGEDLATLVAELARTTLDGGRDVLVVVPGPVSEVADRVLAEVEEDARVSTCAAVRVRGSATGPGYVRVRAWRASSWASVPPPSLHSLGSGSPSSSTRRTRRTRSVAAPGITSAR